MAGRYSKRKHKKLMKSGGFSGSDIQYVRRKKKRKTAKRSTRTTNPTVYDAAGKAFGKFRRSAAAKVARVIGGTVGKPKSSKNPRSGAMIFKTKAAATAYAKTHKRRGVRISIKKLSKAR